MKNFLLIFLFFSTFAVNLQALNTVFCSNLAANYSLNPGDGLFFESPNYPLSVSSGKTNNSVQCSANFMRTDNAGDLIFFFTNGKTVNFQLEPATRIFDSKPTGSCPNCWNYNSNFDRNLAFRARNQPQVMFSYGAGSDSADWSAFQSFVFAPKQKMTTDCFLNNEKFDLTNVNQIIPLYAVGNDSLQSMDSCEWRFNVPSGFALKIVVNFIRVSINHYLNIIGNSGQIVQNPGVYFSNATTVKIQYDKFRNVTYGLGLKGYITLIHQSIPLTTANCHTTSNGNTILYLNSDNNQGYQNDWACSTNLLNIQANKTYTFTQTKSYYEKFGEKLGFKYPKNSTVNFPFLFGDSMIYDTSLSTDLQLEFISDGSVVQNGFEVQQIEKNCSCPNPELMTNCDSTYASYTFWGYCSNIDCSFVMKPNSTCPDRVMNVFIYPQLRDNTADTVVVNVGQSKTIVNSAYGQFQLDSLLPSTKVTMQMISGPPAVPVYTSPSVGVLLYTFAAPKFSNIELTQNNPIFALNMYRTFGVYNVSVPVGNTVEISLIFENNSYFSPDNYDLYDGPDRIGNLNILQSPNVANKMIPPRYTSKRGYLMLFNKFGAITSSTAFFRNVEVHTQNCGTTNNVIKMPISNGTVQMKSLSTGPCMWTVVAPGSFTPFPYLITTLSTVTTKQISVLPNADSKYPLFAFTGSDSSKWNGVTLTSYANTFILPDSETLTMNVDKLSLNRINYNNNAPKNITGIVYSPNYADPNAPLFVNDATVATVIYDTNEFLFTCKALDLGTADSVTINGIFVTHIGQQIIIKNNVRVDVNFTSQTFGKRGFLLEYSAKLTGSNSASNNVFNFLLFFGIFFWFYLLI